ncbi:glucosamine-6-phosphate synthase [Backusella circina FSU 941]|nr:glucosamine-6-phosphate synthase [Backusella circina FSU 941]
MCGIFGYCNFLCEKSRREICDNLLNGLSRLEYRGYDSAGFSVDGDNDDIAIMKQVGKVAALRKLVDEQSLDFERPFVSHCGMAHTRWATHGQPSQINSHPQRSDTNNEFTLVHNGIITNYKELKTLLEKKGFVFESDTDTECVAKLTKYIFDSNKGDISFTDLVKAVVLELEGSYAFIFKSNHFPNEIVATRRGMAFLRYRTAEVRGWK